MALVGKLDILLITKTQQMEKGLKRGSTLTDRFSKSLTKTSRQLIGFGAAAAGAATAVYTIARALQAVIRESDGFNKSLNFSLAIINKLTVSQERLLRLESQRAVFGTVFKAPETAKSLFYLESAGMTPEQAAGALPTALAFSQASGGMIDLSSSVDLLTDSQTALGMASDDTQQSLDNLVFIADRLVGANTIANQSVQQFAEGLTNKAAARARFLGVSLSETLAVLGIFADQAKKGADGGTALEIVWRELTNKAVENQLAFRKLGVEVFDLNDNFRGTANIIEDLEEAFEGLGVKAKTQKVLDLGFQQKSANFLLMLLGSSEKIRENTRRIDEMGGKMEDVSGRMQTEWGKLTKGLMDTGSWFARNTVGSTIETWAFTINTFGGAVRDIFNTLGGFNVDPFDTMAGGAATAADAIDDLGDSLERAATPLSEMMDKLQERVDVFGLTEIEKMRRQLDTLLPEGTDMLGADRFTTEGQSFIVANRLLDRLEGLGEKKTLGEQFESLMTDVESKLAPFKGTVADQLKERLFGMPELDTPQYSQVLQAINELQGFQQQANATKQWPSAWDIQQAGFEKRQKLDRFAQQFATPGETFERLTEDLQFKLAEGQDPEIIRRALVAGIQDRNLALGTDRPPEGAAALTQGTQAAFAAEQEKRGRETAKEHLRVAEEANVILEQINTNLGNAAVTVAPIRR